MTVPDSKVTSLIWGTLDHTIITGHEDGAITQWDLRVCIIYKKYIFIKYIVQSGLNNLNSKGGNNTL